MADDDGKGQALSSQASPATDGAAAAAPAFDLEAAIRQLLADPSSQSIDLPATLTAAERKHAKQVVESHQGLTCESFGFGAERQLRIFKKPSANGGAAAGAPSGVSVKNTFIDDWVAKETPDTRAVQSMPHGMFGQSLLAESRSQAPAERLPTQEEAPPSPAPQQEAPAPASQAGSAFQPGAQVVVHGLTKAPAFNGLSAVVQHLDESCERYSVLLSTGQVAKIKAENLQLIAPAPQQQYQQPPAQLAYGAPAPIPNYYHGPATMAAPAPPLRLTALV